MIDAADPETDTGVHLRGRRRLIARVALIVDRLERVGSDRPPAPSSGPTVADMALADPEDVELEPDDFSRPSVH